MTKTLFVLNDPPYGSERSFNGLRMAGALSKRAGEELKIFLLGDAIACAKSHQKVPPGFYNLEVMLHACSQHGAEVGVCGTCMDSRGVNNGELTQGAQRSTLEKLTDWTQWADKVLVF